MLLIIISMALAVEPCQINVEFTVVPGPGQAPVTSEFIVERTLDERGRLVEARSSGPLVAGRADMLRWDARGRPVERVQRAEDGTAITVWTATWRPEGVLSELRIDDRKMGAGYTVLTFTWRGRFGIGGPVAAEPVPVEWPLGHPEILQARTLPYYLDFVGTVIVEATLDWSGAVVEAPSLRGARVRGRNEFRNRWREEITFDTRGRRVEARFWQHAGRFALIDHTINYEYDAGDRLISEVLVEQQGPPLVLSRFSYDSVGALMREEREPYRGPRTFLWDEHGRLAEMADFSSPAKPVIRRFTYDCTERGVSAVPDP